MTVTELLVGLAIVVGLVGIVVPVLPGSILILVAIVVWASESPSTTAWVTTGVAAGLLVVGAVVKYTVPRRALRAGGVPNRSIVSGGLLGIVGFFVIPVVGLFVGFVLGVYLAEVRRTGREEAWPSTRAALRATGLSILIELVAALLATSVWLVGAVLT